jgi:hypothetical protein
LVGHSETERKRDWEINGPKNRGSTQGLLG